MSQGQAGWYFEQSGLVEDVLPHGRGVELEDLEHPFQPKVFYDDSMIHKERREKESFLLIKDFAIENLCMDEWWLQSCN